MNFERCLPLTLDLLLNSKERTQRHLSKYNMDRIHKCLGKWAMGDSTVRRGSVEALKMRKCCFCFPKHWWFWSIYQKIFYISFGRDQNLNDCNFLTFCKKMIYRSKSWFCFLRHMVSAQVRVTLFIRWQNSALAWARMKSAKKHLA